MILVPAFMLSLVVGALAATLVPRYQVIRRSTPMPIEVEVLLPRPPAGGTWTLTGIKTRSPRLWLTVRREGRRAWLYPRSPLLALMSRDGELERRVALQIRASRIDLRKDLREELERAAAALITAYKRERHGVDGRMEDGARYERNVAWVQQVYRDGGAS